MERASCELVIRAQRRDAVAFARLVEAHERAALAVAYAAVRHPESAADVVQDAFMKAWRCIGELRDPGQFGSWLMRIVRNAAADYRRKRGSRGVESDEALDGVAAGSDGPVERVERGDLGDRIEAALSELDEVTRTVVMLRYYDGMSSREIGDVVDLSPAAVDMRLSRGRAALRERLATVAGPKEQE